MSSDMSLEALLRRANDILHTLQAGTPLPLSSSSKDDQKSSTQSLLEEALECIDKASNLVDTLALISRNEEVEDIQTSSLKYLLIPHTKALILSYTPVQEPERRLGALSASVQFHRYFLLSLQQHKFISDSAKNSRNSELGGSGGIFAVALDEDRATTLDAATLRIHKIEKFKREKALKSKLEALEKARAAEIQGAENDDDGGIDEQEERELYLAQLELAALKSSEEIPCLKKELEMLQHSVNIPVEEREALAANHDAENSKIMQEIRRAATGLRSERDRLRQEVFRPSHILPTMSVEQQGEIELREAMERQKLEGERDTERAAKEAERGSDDEEEVYRQRAMDDWKDENPTGWGNSKLRPCG